MERLGEVEGVEVSLPRGEEGKGTSPGRGRLERGLKYLGDVTQQDSRESLRQRTLKGSRVLGPYNYSSSSQ